MRRLSPSPTTPLIVALLLLCAALLVVALRLSPPSPVPGDAGDAGRFSARRAAELRRRLIGDLGPHPVGSVDHERLRARLVAELSALGFPPRVQEAVACGDDGSCARVRNLIALVPGQQGQPGQQVMLASHYDSVAAGPGASDDFAGVVALLEIARVLRAGPPLRHGVVLLFTDGEEAGLLGARAFIDEAPEAATVRAVVNLEARGTSGPSLLFETSDDNAWLVGLYGAAPHPLTSSVFYTGYRRLPNDTDLTVFRRHGLSGVNFAFVGDVANYHTPLDDLSHGSPASLQHHGDNALAMIRGLAAADLSSAAMRTRGAAAGGVAARGTTLPGGAVFFDVLGLHVFRYPTWSAVPLAVLAIGLLALGGRKGRLRAARAALAGGLLLGTLLVAALVGGALWMVTGGPGAAVVFPAHLGVLVLACWLLGLATMVAGATLSARWLAPREIQLGGWLALGVLALGLSAFSPGVSYPVLLPALLAGICALVPGRIPGYPALDSPGRFGQGLRLLPLLCAALLMFPIVLLLPEALGQRALAVLAPLVGLVLCHLIAPLAAAGRRWRRGIAAGALLLAGGLILVDVYLPVYSARSPQRLNLAYSAGGPDLRAPAHPVPAVPAEWLVLGGLVHFPKTLGALLPGAGTRRDTPIGGALAFPAPDLGLPPPAWEEVYDTPSGAGRLVHARLRSPRNAAHIRLLLPAETHLLGVTVDGAALQAGVRGSWKSIAYLTLPPQGVVLELELADTQPIDAWLVDESAGLPPAGEGLREARPIEAMPSHGGDVTLAWRRLRI